MFHIALHFLVPAIIAGAFFKKRLKHAWLIMMTTMLVDLDHLLANPVYDPHRCSIGFHPLHHPVLFTLYIGLCFVPKTRLIGLGLTVHMCLDAVDCELGSDLLSVMI